MELAEGNFHGNKTTNVTTLRSNWHAAPAGRSSGWGSGWGLARHKALYYGGPTLGWKDTPKTLPPGTTVLGVFDDVPERLPAIVRLRHAWVRSSIRG